jgi:hypothetical protein
VPTFTLSPVTDADFDPSSPGYHRLTIAANRPADEVWSALHGDSPLFWCRGIKRAAWSSPRPHGVGATRTVTLSNGLKVDERYFRWEESDGVCVNAFTVERANLPLFRRFGERYTVTPKPIGSELVWEFVAEPRLPGKKIFAKMLQRDLEKLASDTRKHFA